MYITDSQTHKILKSLYNVAEKDKNDVIANAASSLAVRLETTKRVHELSVFDEQLIRYANVQEYNIDEKEKSRRKTYKRRSPTLASV